MGASQEHDAPRRGPNRALLALNGALLVGLGFVSLAPRAEAQGEAVRRRGSYAITAGELPVGTDAGVYVLDSANQELLLVKWASGTATPALEVLAYRDLAADTQSRAGR